MIRRKRQEGGTRRKGRVGNDEKEMDEEKRTRRKECRGKD
jgi:hypothetical protein